MFIRDTASEVASGVSYVLQKAHRGIAFAASHPFSALTSFLYAQSALAQTFQSDLDITGRANLQVKPLHGFLCDSHYTFSVKAIFHSWKNESTSIKITTPFFGSETEIHAPSDVVFIQQGNIFVMHGNPSQLVLPTTFTVVNNDKAASAIPFEYIIALNDPKYIVKGEEKVSFSIPIPIWAKKFEIAEGFTGESNMTASYVFSGITNKLIELGNPTTDLVDPYISSIVMYRHDIQDLTYVNLTIPYSIMDMPFSSIPTESLWTIPVECEATKNITIKHGATIAWQANTMFAVDENVPAYYIPMNKTTLFDSLRFTNLNKYPNSPDDLYKIFANVQLELDNQIIKLGKIEARDLSDKLASIQAYASCSSSFSASLTARFYQRFAGFGLGSSHRTISLPIYALPPIATKINLIDPFTV